MKYNLRDPETSNKVINAELKTKLSFERSTYVSRLLKSENMHTLWCTDAIVTNSYSQTSKKQKPLAKNIDWRNMLKKN